MRSEARDEVGMEGFWALTNCWLTACGVGAEKSATITAGNDVRTMQQSFWTDAPESGAEGQQACEDFCVCWRQIPEGASRAPISKMATVAR